DDYIRKTTQFAARLRTAVRSALKRAESRQRTVRLEARLDTLLNRLGVGALKLSRDGRLLEANETFLSLLGLSSVQEAQRVDLTALSGDLPERSDERVSFQRHELQLHRADGTAIRVSVTKTVWRTPTGEPVTDGLLEEVAQPFPGIPQAERRRWPRTEAHLETSVRPNGETSSGTAPNIGLGGLYVVLDRPVPVAENQPIQLGLVTEIGLLEIRGRIHRIRAATGHVVGSPEHLGSGFAVEVEPPQARTTDLNVTGASLRLLAGQPALGADERSGRLVLRLLLKQAVPPIPALASGDVSDLTMPGEIVWGGLDGTEAGTPRVGI